MKSHLGLRRAGSKMKGETMRRGLRHSRWFVVAGSVVAAAGLGLLGSAPARALPANCSQSGFTVTCTYTSGPNSFTVPNGVGTVHVVAVGGKGADSYTDAVNHIVFSAPGGYGARVTGDLTVNGGDTLWAVVGGNGEENVKGANGGGNSGGFGIGGGGGGASDVRTSPTDLATRLIVAAGGGGAGIPASDDGLGGAGGSAGQPGLAGADIGPVNGVSGTGGTGGGPGASNAGGAGGAGGTATGDPNEPGCAGGDGAIGLGGNGGFSLTAECISGAGGGGGGLYGGGAGGGGGLPFALSAGSGGGGGGSSLVPNGGTFSVDGTAVPEVVISYAVPDVVTPSSLDFGSQALGSTSAAKTVTLSDTGSAPIAVSSVAIGGTNAGDFAIVSDPCSGQSIAAGDSCSVQVAFAPTATGPRGPATLSLTDDAGDSPQTVSLTGTGTTLADVKTVINGPASAVSGSQDTYVLSVSNAGPSSALNVVMTAQVPNGTKFVGVSTTQGSCSHPASGSTSGTISCSLGDLASGAAALDSVSLKITLSPKGGSVAVAAQAYSTTNGGTPATPDPNLGNNVASLSTTITKK